MKTNKILDEIRGHISPDVKKQLEISVCLANRVYDILEKKGMTQKDLAKLLGKTERNRSKPLALWYAQSHHCDNCKNFGSIGRRYY